MLILASASPRRKELLEQMGCTFEVKTAPVEEYREGESEELALENSRIKAETVFVEHARAHPEDIILGADTVVSLDDKIYGKPEDSEDAAEMLSALQGKVHTVTTGITLIVEGVVYQAVAKTRVEIAPMSKKEILSYVETGEPLDKAGAYALQGRGARYISRIEGDYTNVIGLPLFTLSVLAKGCGVSL